MHIRLTGHDKTGQRGGCDFEWLSVFLPYSCYRTVTSSFAVSAAICSRHSITLFGLRVGKINGWIGWIPKVMLPKTSDMLHNGFCKPDEPAFTQTVYYDCTAAQGWATIWMLLLLAFFPPRCLSNIWWPFHAYNPMQNKCFPGEMPCSSHIKTTLRLPHSLWLLASNVAKPKLSGKSWEQALRNHSLAFKRQFHLIILFFTVYYALLTLGTNYLLTLSQLWWKMWTTQKPPLHYVKYSGSGHWFLYEILWY